MRGIIWAYRLEDGLQELEEVIEDYKKMGIEVARKQIIKTNSWIIFGNGDYWKVVAAAHHSRGHRANVSYIDYRIDQEIIDTIIRPSTLCSPFQGFKYYYPPDKKE